ncbi:Transport-associated domain protein [Rhodopirellula maiorica SM1]|uniref:Transport-associated domain protein n=1 Tax=Rhodopirellula maiorica SM1 TaxID=1265738 RepID=M5RCU7_9BACT|nr:BON domain-containing protein [Rhodopirellula maiorica]EMI17288.1 Transport-associated domain protein [Rhodopirellula maiorica SM1]
MRSQSSKHPPANPEPLSVRVERIIKRYGFDGVQVSSDQPWHVTLTGTVDDVNDRALVVAIARTTPGVTVVRSEITLTKQN